jgi:UDP-N-acetylmuramate dehydrogenase
MTDLAYPADLQAICPGCVKTNFSLKQIARWNIGGIADCFVEPENPGQVGRIVKYCNDQGLPWLAVGYGSNLLFDDAGFKGVIIQLAGKLSACLIDGRRVRAQAGIWVPKLAWMLGKRGLTGIEHAIGIPGTLGGLVIMNGGSLHKGIGMNIEYVTVLDSEGNQKILNKSDCGFSYRYSVLQDAKNIVLEAELSLARRDKAQVRKEMLSILRSRRNKFPLKLPNCGSVFLNNPKIHEKVGPPGKIIEEAGLKGVKIGGAQVSTLHANFIVNLGTASSNDVLRLVSLIRARVFENTNYSMDCEIHYVSPAGSVKPLHEALSQFKG